MGTEQRLLLPRLAPLYAAVAPCAYVFLRVVTGVMMATFGYAKLFGAGVMTHQVEEFHHLGLEPAYAVAHFIGGLEFFGGIAIAIGLLVRPLAAMFVVEMLVILAIVMLPRGTGYQLSVVLLANFAFILSRGAGCFSVDRVLGREF